MRLLLRRFDSQCHTPAPPARLSLFTALFLTLALCACRTRGPDPTESAVTSDGLLVFGKVSYVIDGQPATRYGPSGTLPTPSMDLVNLDTGEKLGSRRVQAEDGTFVWRLFPAHYVVTAIGSKGEYRAPWPRVAFRVPAVLGSIYLGHLQLLGTTFSETVSTPEGKSEAVSGIRYTYAVLDEFDAANARMRSVRGSESIKSLMFIDGSMPVEQAFLNAITTSREAMIDKIFGSSK
jgi:hypothetical protein